MVALVNYVRSLVDDAARRADSMGNPKAFLCVLHAPPHMLYSSSLYSAVFLDGWSQHAQAAADQGDQEDGGAGTDDDLGYRRLQTAPWRFGYVDSVRGPRLQLQQKLVEELCRAAAAGSEPVVDTAVLTDPLASVSESQLLHEFVLRLRIVGAGPSAEVGQSRLAPLYAAGARAADREAALVRFDEQLQAEAERGGLLKLCSLKASLGLHTKKLGQTTFEMVST